MFQVILVWFFIGKTGVFEMCHFRAILIGKTQCLRESGFKSYVFYRCDVQKQANGLRGSDAHHSQVRSLPTKVEVENVMFNRENIDFINFCMVKHSVCENPWSNHMCFTKWTSKSRQTAWEWRRRQASSTQPVSKSATATGLPKRRTTNPVARVRHRSA